MGGEDTPKLTADTDLSKVTRISIIHDVLVFAKISGVTWTLRDIKFTSGEPCILSFTSTKVPTLEELVSIAKEKKTKEERPKMKISKRQVRFGF